MATNAAEVQQEGGPEGLNDAQRERISAIIGRLDGEADRRVGKRNVIEKRWLTDLAQYHGRYDSSLVAKLKDARKSTLFINSTRPKTNTMASRLSDMLFPTDDRNWGIHPTPVPELTVAAEQAAEAAATAELDAAETPDDQDKADVAAQATAESKQIKARIDEARKRSRAMEEEIDDHLRESQYSAQAREVIDDGCKLGTGIMKGPVIGDRTRRAWKQVDIIGDSGTREGQAYEMTEATDPRAALWRVDPWNFFPDMDATRIEDSEGNFERHLLNNKQLRRLARNESYDKDAIRRLVVQGPQDNVPTYLADMRSITGSPHDETVDRFHVWEYHGPLTLDEMQEIANLMGDEGIQEDLAEQEIDPLDEIEAVIWFCQGELLKFGMHYLDSGDPIYSVWCLEKDDASIFGFGIPYIMRDPQSAMSSAWRTLMDNAGFSGGPMVVINDTVIEPYNGVWALEPRKIWLRKAGAPKGEKAFEIFAIPSEIEQLEKLIDMCKRNADEETNLPILAQGEQGASVTKTAQGMALLMNSVNVIFRRTVKNWDDNMTSTTIRRIYDFLMQFSEKEYIKGDYEVDARGTSVLLVREMQSANLLLFLSNFAGHATLGKYLKDEGLPGLRHLAKTMMIPADDLVKSDEEVDQDAAKAASSPPVPNPEIMKLEMQGNLKQMEWDGKLELAYLNRETELIKLAGLQNMKLDELKAKLDDARQDRQSKERIFAGEAALTDKYGKGGGGYL